MAMIRRWTALRNKGLKCRPLSRQAQDRRSLRHLAAAAAVLPHPVPWPCSGSYTQPLWAATFTGGRSRGVALFPAPTSFRTAWLLLWPVFLAPVVECSDGTPWQLDPNHLNAAATARKPSECESEKWLEEVTYLCNEAVTIMETNGDGLAATLDSLAKLLKPQSAKEASTMLQQQSKLQEGEPKILFRIASALHDHGRYDEALLFCLHSMRICKKGANQVDLTYPLSLMGAVLKAKGELHQAAECHRRAAEIREQQLGPGHLDVASSLNQLALVHKVMGHSEEAVALTRRALAIREASLGPKHLEVASTLYDLALSLKAKLCYQEAAEALQRALPILSVELGDEHYYVMAAASDLKWLQQHIMGHWC